MGTGVVCLCIAVVYASLLRRLAGVWWTDPEFSFGALVPAMSAYLIWSRRESRRGLAARVWLPGFGLLLIGCLLHVLGVLGGSLLVDGLSLVLVLEGAFALLVGPAIFRVIAGPIALLVLMVPLPSYVVGQLAWRLQVAASTVSSALLRLLDIPVLQDGNVLRLSNYALEVKQACSGSRSIFALLALAVVLGLSVERKWMVRIALVIAAPVLAIGANVVRIVGTGIIAHNWGAVAASESLHAVWGIVVFLLAVSGLMFTRKVLRWLAASIA